MPDSGTGTQFGRWRIAIHPYSKSSQIYACPSLRYTQPHRLITCPARPLPLVWTQDNALPDLPLVFNVGENAKAREVDLMGNSKPLPVSQGRVLWNIGREPKYLVLENAATLQSEGTLLRVERAGALLPGGQTTLTATLRKPLSTPQTVRAIWQVPAPLLARGPLSVEQTLAPGAEKAVTLQVSAPAALPATRAFEVGVNATVVGTTLQVQSSLPVPVGIASGGNGFERAPDFVLNQESDIVNLNDVDPNTMYLTWKGPQDLSARVWVGRDADALLLRFEVRDDVHKQPYAGAQMWQGDSVQVGLNVPGQSGSFEFGLERDDAGKSRVHSWLVPKGFNGGEVFDAIKLETSRRGDLTIYNARLPLSAFGLDAEKLRSGIGLSFIVNDLDEDAPNKREGFARLSEGVGANRDATRFPVVVVR